jgi:hypothetical protein
VDLDDLLTAHCPARSLRPEIFDLREGSSLRGAFSVAAAFRHEGTHDDDSLPSSLDQLGPAEIVRTARGSRRW